MMKQLRILSGTNSRTFATDLARFVWPTIIFAAIVFVILGFSRVSIADENWQVLSVVGESPQLALLESIDAEMVLSFRIRGDNDQQTTKQVAHEDLVRWGAYDDIAEFNQILLTDGSLLVANVDSFDNGILEYRSRAWTTNQLEEKCLRGVNLLPSRDVAIRSSHLSSLRSIDSSGTLFMSNEDRLQGVVVEIDESRATDLRFIKVKTENDTFDFSFQTVRCFSFPAEMRIDELQNADSTFTVGFVDGSMLKVTAIEVRQDGVQFRLACGAIMKNSATDGDLFNAISFIQSNSPRVQYLSGIEPLQTGLVPQLTAGYGLKRDKSAIGTPLRNDGHTFPRGIGMHATSSSSYKTGDDWTRFAAEIAIDDSSGQRGSVVFRVFLLNSENKWAPAFESAIVRGGSRAVPISIELNDASAIAIAVDQSDLGDVLDRANWLNARFEK